MKIRNLCVLAAFCAILSSVCFADTPGILTINVNQPKGKIGPLFYGLMTEEINHSYDGGLYAELIQNRIFQDRADPAHWSVVQGGAASGKIAIDESNPVNEIALKRSLRLDITAVDGGQRVGVANDGFWGIPVRPDTKYHASFYARASDDFSGPLTVDIESNDGATTFASAVVPSVDAKWKKYEVDLTTGKVAPSTANRFVISAAGKGSVWFSLVSLFPPTYNDRPNGNRIDLMQALAGLHPSFLRFPGGNYLEGDRIVDHFDWKKMIGPLEDRPGHACCWGYRSSDGFGLLEFLDWCEDLHMEPLLAVYAGYSLSGQHVAAGAEMRPFVQEALDEIEYCTGDASTTWGQRRIKDGHPAPFTLHYVEIGNEDGNFDYDGRFTQMSDAIKAKYPHLQCIASGPVHTRKPDLIDDHYYPSPQGMLGLVHRYDKRGANEPKVFCGEWASQNGSPTPTMHAALTDAAWLTGLQNDAETVLMNCYAPLLVNVNRGAGQWGTNLIGYDAMTTFGSPSYYAQAMISNNRGDTILPVEMTIPPPTQLPAPRGFVGVGTWRTSAEFKDIKVTHGDQTLFQSDFSSDLKGWKPHAGKWAAHDGVLSQTDGEREDIRLTSGDKAWQDYVLTLKARKTSGTEGFLIMFHVRDNNNFLWFNVGGWNNSRSAIEQAQDGEKSPVGDGSSFKVETGKWYDIRIEVQGRQIKCFVDNKLITQGTDGSSGPRASFFVAASRVDSTGEVILKVVNTRDVPQPMEIKLNGVTNIAKDATLEVLAGQPGDINSVESPTKVAPRQLKMDDAGTTFAHEFPAYSVSVIRLKPQ